MIRDRAAIATSTLAERATSPWVKRAQARELPPKRY
jgi:hypothetical protein